MFQKILIANRGEIAVRIIRACRELGIRTVAVYSTVDEDCLHVHLADEKVCIGPGPAKDSYLNPERVIAAAEITDAEAIHPGYGFLAENTTFAEICQSCRIKFIGPSPQAMAQMGDKAVARRTVQATGIPVIPGSEGVVQGEEEGLRLAHEIGYPVMVKAAGGGGGRGMRVAHTDVTLSQVMVMAAQEAERSFGTAEIYLEKYIERPSHIEIQLLADEHGHVIHLGERDCSIQRRYQKVVEESPSPRITPEMRREMGEAAVKIAQAVNYTSCGTVEFLLDNGRFYFMEMNTRIQVEHPVTELVTGLDLVKLQIACAAGEPLPLTQEQVTWHGHAIECRINAENPKRNFLPSPGRVTAFWQPGGPGVRVDTHVYQDYVVPPNYDSLLAKLLVFGHDREEAIMRMRRALDEFVIEGVHTNVRMHQSIMQNLHFMDGKTDTQFLASFLESMEL